MRLAEPDTEHTQVDIEDSSCPASKNGAARRFSLAVTLDELINRVLIKLRDLKESPHQRVTGLMVTYSRGNDIVDKRNIPQLLPVCVNLNRALPRSHRHDERDLGTSQSRHPFGANTSVDKHKLHSAVCVETYRPSTIIRHARDP